MRVLHINPGNLFGGVETFLITLARCRETCPEMEPAFAVCVPGRLEQELQQTGVVVHVLGKVQVSRPWTVWSARSALRRVLATDRFDVVICHQAWTQAVFGPVARRLPLVAYFHGPCDGGWPEWLARRQRPRLIVAPSSHTLETLRPLFPGIRATVLHYPLPSQVTTTRDLLPGERAALRAELGTVPEEVVVLQASRLEPWKGPDRVLRALSRLREVPNWRFWLAGGAQRPSEVAYFLELRRLANTLGIADRVVLLGQRSDVATLMRAADLYCQGNRSAEGFGLSFLEAGFCGLPSVTSDLGGVQEIIDPSTGILVAPDDVEALADALRTLIVDKARRLEMGARARAKVIARFDTAQQLERLRQSLLQVLEVEVRSIVYGH
jgi:glycosyltransferase involved in cell wall biosynthesis